MTEDQESSENSVSLVKINIQDIIRDRKEEMRLMAVEKRQVDLQRIRDMRSKAGIHPLQQFPKEIWMKIFDDLDPEDKCKIYQLHPIFRELLESSCHRDILLPMLLQLDAFHSIASSTVGSEFSGQLRIISTSAMKSYNRWMEDSLRKRIAENQAVSFNSSLDCDTVNLCSSEAIRKASMMKRLLSSFLEGKETSGKCFFPRALTVYLFDEPYIECDGEDDEIYDDDERFPQLIKQFISNVTALLTIFGDQIWHFRFFVEEAQQQVFLSSHVYILFQRWITLMPNLKWLEVSIDKQIKEGCAEEMLALQKYPFPNLMYLERLSLHSIPYLSSGIFKFVLEANQQIKTLDLCNEAADVAILPPNLIESLQLTWFTVGDEDWSCRERSSCLAKIQPIVNYKWALRTIVLDLHSSRQDSIISVFELLQKFPTLEQVKLKRLEEFHVRYTHKLGYLELPNLMNFELELTSPEIDFGSCVHFFSLQFLLYCKKLKRISWKITGFDDSKLKAQLKMYEIEKFGNLIDFRGGLRCVYESNIWHLFPCLDIIDVLIRRDKDENSEYCAQRYIRKDLECMSLRKFWKSHGCSDSICVL